MSPQDGELPAMAVIPQRDGSIPMAVIQLTHSQHRTVRREGQTPGFLPTDRERVQLRACFHVPEPDLGPTPRDGEDPTVPGECQGHRGTWKTFLNAG